jgi:hypothetical protein
MKKMTKQMLMGRDEEGVVRFECKMRMSVVRRKSLDHLDPVTRYALQQREGTDTTAMTS